MKQIKSFLKSSLRPLLAVVLVVSLVFSQADSALAARTGGRIGGSSFRRSAPPSRVYQRPPGGTSVYPGGYPGGGFGFPFLLPFFGFGGGFGGLLSIFVVIAIANFLVGAFRRTQGDGAGYADSYSNPTVTTSKIQVGLLAEARGLQNELNQLAQRADTSSAAGLDLVLQETTLALTRHPEYWAYATSEAQQSRLEAAETQFNRLALTERSKVQEETLVNVNRQLRQAEQPNLPAGEQSGDLLIPPPSEYIVVTLLVAAQGKLDLPKVNTAEELREALNKLGGISSDQLLALEVLWAPQASSDTLTAEDLLTAYPTLKPL